jgi:hypothetical protein
VKDRLKVLPNLCVCGGGGGAGRVKEIRHNAVLCNVDCSCQRGRRWGEETGGASSQGSKLSGEINILN